MKRKIVFLQENMANENDRVTFEADIPYEVDSKNRIENEDGIKMPIDKIWVDFLVVHRS